MASSGKKRKLFSRERKRKRKRVTLRDNREAITSGKKEKKIEGQSSSSSSSSWSDLPEDIICLILNRLHYIDQIRFRAVCKGWRELADGRGVKSLDKLPWMMTIGDSINSYYLFDPSEKRKYTIRNSMLNDARVLASKQGWVLFTEETITTDALFFYTPFTDQIIRLPKLNINLPTYYATTFTTSPVSPNCEIFTAIIIDKKIIISMCKPGDKRWKEFVFPAGAYELIDDIEYLHGIIYCSLDHAAAIGAFNTRRKCWKVLHPAPLYRGRYMEIAWVDLIECNGNLLAALYIADWKRWRVFRLHYTDYSHMMTDYYWLEISHRDWLETEKIDHKSLFLDHTASTYRIFAPINNYFLRFRFLEEEKGGKRKERKREKEKNENEEECEKEHIERRRKMKEEVRK
ncbi:F-box protein [Melia azedarach]|uniref:F-box protein n=1 Tax=Melia azedarach TaxID=155640 RepID=A0ACC1WPL0_MELAZ|nr:F-box protein [Melia azedarach]